VSNDSVISVEGVSKRFRLYHERNQSLKSALMRRGRVRYDEFWALKDVSFEVRPGMTFGLVGHNGSGKSTMLKCIARILRPEKGKISVDGRMSALLELGAGFHPELSGRENVYLNGSILGMSKRQLEQKFDEIVGFAGLERFIDMPVKNYSSGMYVRLGFSIAINVNPDILLVDEVLDVGGEEDESGHGTRWGSGHVRIVRVDLHGPNGQPTEQIRTGDEVTFRLHYEAARSVERPVFGLGVFTLEGVQVSGPNTREAGVWVEHVDGAGVVELHIDRLLLLPGSYVVSAAATDETISHTFDHRHKALHFDVKPGTPHETYGGVISFDGRWGYADPA
jgi:ABC-type polysaccharide/polyol phosphate transport system ATPase subunit